MIYLCTVFHTSWYSSSLGIWSLVADMYYPANPTTNIHKNNFISAPHFIYFPIQWCLSYT